MYSMTNPAFGHDIFIALVVLITCCTHKLHIVHFYTPLNKMAFLFVKIYQLIWEIQALKEAGRPGGWEARMPGGKKAGVSAH